MPYRIANPIVPPPEQPSDMGAFCVYRRTDGHLVICDRRRPLARMTVEDYTPVRWEDGKAFEARVVARCRVMAEEAGELGKEWYP